MSDISNSLRSRALQYNIGQTVGDGSCWAFVNEALVNAGGRSRMDRPGAALYQWGQVVRQRTMVRPGHVIQFNASSSYSFTPSMGAGTTASPRTFRTGSVHSAIVIDVYNQGKQMRIRHQNFGAATLREMFWYFDTGSYTEDGGRSITVTEVDYAVTFYRPDTTS